MEAQTSLYYSNDEYAPQQEVRVYTDGSTLGNGKTTAKGGIGVFMPETELVDEVVLSESVLEPKPTNNRCELHAIFRALEVLEVGLSGKERATPVIITDSMYAWNIVTGHNRAHLNKDVVEKVMKRLVRVQRKGIRPVFKHVYAHTKAKTLNAAGNRLADLLARKGADSR